MFPNQFLAVKNMLRKTKESLLLLLPMCKSYVILVNMARAHPMQFS